MIYIKTKNERIVTQSLYVGYDWSDRTITFLCDCGRFDINYDTQSEMQRDVNTIDFVLDSRPSDDKVISL